LAGEDGDGHDERVDVDEATGSIRRLWPFFGLRVSCGGIELRVPTDDDLAALAELAREPIHPVGYMPFSTPWTLAPADQRVRGVLKWHWRTRAEWAPEHWQLEMVAVNQGRVVGTQGLHGDNFAVTKEVSSGSWVGGAFQGQGIGTGMRRAMLQLAFLGLGASQARSGAFADNGASRRVSEKLGYLEDGTESFVRGGEPTTMIRFLLTRARWQEQATRWPAAEIEGWLRAAASEGLVWRRLSVRVQVRSGCR
jgi:RimJ/RimL family protein N-acetyltransferase